MVIFARGFLFPAPCKIYFQPATTGLPAAPGGKLSAAEWPARQLAGFWADYLCSLYRLRCLEQRAVMGCYNLPGGAVFVQEGKAHRIMRVSIVPMLYNIISYHLFPYPCPIFIGAKLFPHRKFAKVNQVLTWYIFCKINKRQRI